MLRSAGLVTEGYFVYGFAQARRLCGAYLAEEEAQIAKRLADLGYIE
jgi:hypothetical protein